MPAGSDPVTLPHTWRPLGVRVAATVLFSLLAVVVGFAWFSFAVVREAVKIRTSSVDSEKRTFSSGKSATDAAIARSNQN